MGRQENDGNIKMLTDAAGRFDAVGCAIQPDVHQNQVGLGFVNPALGFFGRLGQTSDAVAQPFQAILNIGCHHCLIFDDHNVWFAHFDLLWL